MYPLVKKIAYRVLVPLLGRYARLRLAGDLAAAAPPAARLLAVLQQTLRDDFSPAERAWFARIEHLRSELAASAEPVAVTDYGAGTPDATRSAEQMRQGVVFEATVGDICRRASKPPFWTRLLFALVREYRPQRGLELGTCLGVSASYQGAALLLSGQPAQLYTLEGAAALVPRAQGNLDGLGLGALVQVVPGRFDQTLPTLLAAPAAIDYAFIDGHHDEHATIAYFEQLKPKLAPGAVLVFDDISWSPGMRRAWQVIAADPCFAVTLDLRAVGVGVLGTPRGAHYRYYLR